MDEQRLAVDHKILDGVVGEIERKVMFFNQAVERQLAEMRLAASVEQVMLCKKRILMDFLAFMPLNAWSCYFCGIQSRQMEHCDGCLYAKYHGKCCAEDNSTYEKIMAAKEQLMKALDDYYRGETYS